MPRLVLSVSGGGVRDVIPAQILDLLKDDLQIGLERFDLIVGVSGGSMITAYGMQFPDEPLTGLFTHENLERMLQKSVWDRMVGEVQFEPMYSDRGKIDVLRQNVGCNSTMGQLPGKLAIPAYNLSKRKTELFTSYDDDTKTVPIWKVCNASSAAMPYFPAFEIGGSWYADGGFATNDPVLVAYSEARRLFGEREPLRILSIGSGAQPADPKWSTPAVEKWGLVPWIQNGFVDLLMDAPNDFMVGQTAKLLALESPHNRLLCINDPIDKIPLDDSSEATVQKLRDYGRTSYIRHRSDLVSFFGSESPQVWRNTRTLSVASCRHVGAKPCE